ncbi:MAG TPA: hypothetical protein VGF13_00960 [Verrucomicrobiae bacterium]
MPFYEQARLSQFMGEDHFVNSFQQSWPKAGMDFKGGVQNDFREFVLVHSFPKTGELAAPSTENSFAPFA